MPWMKAIDGGARMKPAEPVDYLAAMEQLRQEEKAKKHQIRSPEFIPSRADEPVNYPVASRAWETEQKGKYKIHMQRE